jgi:hypothetical protein
MNETRTRGGPNLGLLLLIPAAIIVAKAATHRRAMMASGWGAAGPGGHGHGQRRFGGFDGEAGPRGFRLPPRIEAALDDWHTRTHEAAATSKPEADAPSA